MDHLVGQPALQHAVDEAGEIRMQTLATLACVKGDRLGIYGTGGNQWIAGGMGIYWESPTR
jgi:hypothetical protein